MESNEPLVSIVCDTYNQAPYIRDALDGFLCQKTDFCFEIIVHDDASTDGTAEVVREYETKYPDLFRCVYRGENVYSRDPKILEHVAICEGDDYWTAPDKLQKQVAYMEANPNCTLCVCAADIVDPEGNRVGSVAPYEFAGEVPMNDMIRGGGGFVPTASIVAPTRLAQNRAPFCDMTDVDDAVLQLWFGANGKTHYFSEHMCAYRTAVPGSWTETFLSADKDARIRHHESMVRALEAFDEETGSRWHAAVHDAIVHHHTFEILCLKSRVDQLRKPEHRAQYKMLSKQRRLRLNMEHLAPNLTACLMQGARRLRKR
jgi:hypothetical protein